MRRLVSRHKVLTLCGILFTGLLLAACGGGQVRPVTEDGKSLHSLYKLIFWVGFVVFVLVEAAIILMVLRFRRRPRDDDSLPPQIHGNSTLEIVWTAIPAVIVVVLFFVSWRQINRAESLDKSPGVVIDVQGLQWTWKFGYPEGFDVTGSPPEMVVPVGESVRFNLRSEDVIHSFYVPQMLYKLDVVPGHHNAFTTTFTKTGRYRGQCAELCGTEHAKMVFFVRVVDRAEYDTWVAEQLAASRAREAASTSCAPEGDIVKVSAKDTKFDKDCLAAPAGTPFEIAFDNEDPFAHNVAIYKSKAEVGKDALFKGTVFAGPKTETYDVNPLPAGSYYFICDLHPAAMTGTFNVGAPAGTPTGNG